jgi:hypothetical protein
MALYIFNGGGTPGASLGTGVALFWLIASLQQTKILTFGF